MTACPAGRQARTAVGSASVSDAPGLPIEYRPHFDRQSGKTASPDKASVEVARRIIDDLVKQGYRVGDRFPPEPDMLKVYEVSRETLREGLRLLEVQGLITIRRGPGGGPRVAPVNAAYLARSASLYFHVSGATYREVFEAWLDMEPTLVARVARREDRGEVARVLKPFTHTELGNDPRAVFDSAAAFHSEIGRLSGNRLLVLLLQSMNHILTELDDGAHRPHPVGCSDRARPRGARAGDRQRARPQGRDAGTRPHHPPLERLRGEGRRPDR